MCGCENDVNEVKELGRRKPSIDEGKQIDSYLSMNGKMRAHLTAPVVLRYQGDSAKKAEFPNSLHVDFFNDSLKIESQINARYGYYLENDNKIYLRDNVVAFNVKGDTLFCEDLHWDQANEKFYTNKKVTVSRGFRRTLIVALDGMTSNQDLSIMSFYNIQPNSFTHVSDSATSSPGTAPIMSDTAKKKQ